MFYGSSVDLRKGVDRLCGLVRMYSLVPTDGSVYVFSPEARKVLEDIATLYEIEANLKSAKADHDEIRRQRQEQSVPTLDFIKLMLEKYKTVDTPESALTKGVQLRPGEMGEPVQVLRGGVLRDRQLGGGEEHQAAHARTLMFHST